MTHTFDSGGFFTFLVALAQGAARGKVAAAAKPFFERQRNESRVGGGPHGDLL